MPNVVHRIVIELDEKGAVSVTGPTNDRILMYGMLDAAREAVIRMAMGNSITVPTADELLALSAAKRV